MTTKEILASEASDITKLNDLRVIDRKSMRKIKIITLITAIVYIVPMIMRYIQI